MKTVDIFREASHHLEKGEHISLATIASTSGSTPAGPSAKMIVLGDGSEIIGTIGGGCLEAGVIQDARMALHSKTQRIIEYELKEDDVESGLICGGMARILVEPMDNSFLPLLAELVSMQDSGGNGVLVSRVEHGIIPQKTLILPDKIHGFDLPGEVVAAVRAQYDEVTGKEKAQMLQSSAGIAYLMEPVIGRPTLLIFGGGHVSFFVAHFAKFAGFRVVIIDDRERFANRERFPEADETIVTSFDTVFQRLDIPPSCYITIITRGHAYDEWVLEQALNTEAKYIGMIGSRRKVILTLNNIRGRGMAEEKLEKVFAPIGLDIGAASPAEIGISIVGEMIKVRRKGEDTPIGHMAAAAHALRAKKNN